METDDTPSYEPSEAAAIDGAQAEAPAQDAEAQAPASVPPSTSGTQDVPISVDETGQGWGLVGLYKADVGDIEIDPPGGEVTLENGGEGITKLVLTGAEPDSVVHLHVGQRDDSIT